VIEKTVFGILCDTRKLWVQLLCGTDLPPSHLSPASSPVAHAFAPAPAPDSSSSNNDFMALSNPNSVKGAPVDVVEDRNAICTDEAQSFISNVILRCINLLDVNNGRELMTHALGCVDAWLQVR
jgi:hypothetical protein